MFRRFECIIRNLLESLREYIMDKRSRWSIKSIYRGRQWNREIEIKSNIERWWKNREKKEMVINVRFFIKYENTHLCAVASILRISDGNITWFLDSAKIADISLAYSILLTSRNAIKLYILLPYLDWIMQFFQQVQLI